MVMQLSRMEPVPVRRVWPHEEQDFTPWLAEHFDMLNDALDLNMEVIAPEEVIPWSRSSRHRSTQRRYRGHHREPVGRFG